MTLFVRCSECKGFSWIALIVFLLSPLTISEGNPVVDDEFLIVSVSRINTHPNFRLQTGQIYQIDLTTGRSRPLFNTDPSSSPSYLAIDRKKQVLYYVVGYDEIDSVSLTQRNNDSTVRVIFTDPTSPVVHLNGLAVDAERQKLYLSDAGYYPRIVEIDLFDPNQTLQRILVAGHRLKPKAIVIDEVNSELYWTDLGSKPGIFVISLMDVNVRPQSLISDNIVSPNALAIDFTEEIMYWTDDHFDRIEMSNLNGQDRRVLVQTSIAGIYYFAMTISRRFLYITDQTTGSVLRVDRATNNITEQQMPALNGRKTGIAYYNSNFTNVGRVGRRHTYVVADETITLSTSKRKTEAWRRVRTFTPDETTHSMTTMTHGKVEEERLINVYYYESGEIVIALLVVLGSIFLFIVIIAIISLAILWDRRRHRCTTGVSIAFGYSPAATVACDEVHSSKGRLLLLTDDVYVIKDNNNSDEDLPEVGMHPLPPTKQPDHLPDRME